MFDLIRLLNSDTDSHGIDTWLNQDFLRLISCNSQAVQENFWRGAGLDFRDIMSFRGLRGEVGDGQGCSERGADALKVRAEGLRL